MRILVLGGAGAMAQVTLRDLLESSAVEKVGVADLSRERAEAVVSGLGDPRAASVSVDVRDTAKLTKIMMDWDVVHNSTWYELNLNVMQAAIGAGIHYLDLGGLYHMTRKQLALDKAARDADITCVLGMGSSPGIMNVLGSYAVSKMDRIETMKLRSGSSPPSVQSEEFYPPFSIRTILDEFTLPAVVLRDGKIQEVPELSGKESFVLPEPVGRVEGYYTLHSELATMPFTLQKGIRNMDFIVAYPTEFTRAITLLVRLGFASKKPIQIKGQEAAPYDLSTSVIDLLPRPRQIELDVDIQRVEAWGEQNGKEVVLTVDAISLPNKRWNIGGGTVGTGTPPSIIAQWLASGRIKQRGVLPPESCVEPLPFFRELGDRDRGITIIEKNEQTQVLSE